MPTLSVVVVTHNTADYVSRLLSSLDADPERADWEVLVIDNDSADGTAEQVRERYPWARLVRNSPQRGFAAGLNQGVALTRAPLIVTVNPDTVVPPGAFARLRGALDSDARVAAVGPRIRFPEGRVQRQGLHRPRPYTALVVLLGLARLPVFRREAERYYGEHAPGPPRRVELLPGTCLMFRRSAYEDVGPFDERFFLYCEDVDWCIRAGNAGWRLLFVPEVEIVHHKAASSRAASARVIRTYYRSLRAFYAKHHAPRTLGALNALWYGGAYLKEGAALLADKLRARKGLRY